MLESIKMKREDIYITNIVKYRHQRTATPLQRKLPTAQSGEEEIKLYRPSAHCFPRTALNESLFPKEKYPQHTAYSLPVNTSASLRHFLPSTTPPPHSYNGSLRDVLKRF